MIGCRGVCLGQVETELEPPVMGGRLSAKKMGGRLPAKKGGRLLAKKWEADYQQFIFVLFF